MPKENKAKTKSAPKTLTALVLIGLFLFSIMIIASARGDKTRITINDRVIRADVASTVEQHRKGLGGRDYMPEDEGMLFVFNVPDTYGFWMKDMQFPLDIIWLDSEKQVVSLENNVTPDTYPQAFYPTVPSLYVIEVNAGIAEQYDIKIGDSAEFNL